MERRTPDVSRRSVLRTALAGAGVLAAPNLLVGCDSPGPGDGAAAGDARTALADLLPTYLPSSVVPPDIPGVCGSDPGYLSYPGDPARTVHEVPGAGGTYTAVTPLWGTIPPVPGNEYYSAVNRALGVSLNVQPADGNTYLGTLTKVFSGGSLPDWFDVPSWWARDLGFGELVETACADLTPYLAGRDVQNYPNLANIPTNAWQAAVWNGKLYGIPVFSTNISLSGALYYRKDLFQDRGLPEPTSAEEFFALGRELTDPTAGRWAFDDCWSYLAQPFDIPLGWTTDERGGIVHKYELDRYAEAIGFLARIVRAGYMHPDAVAGNTAEAKRRFVAGAVAIYGDGTGAWAEHVRARALAGDTAFGMQAMAPFSADGTSKPRYALGSGASLFSYLNRNLSRSRVEELLRVANYLAAPYGSVEYTLVNFGERGTHHTMAAGGPRLTAAGGRELATTYQFLATAPAVNALPGYPDWVKAYTAWQGNAAQYVYKPLFYGLNVAEPAEYANLDDPVEAVIADAIRGHRTVDDFRTVVAEWRQRGGDDLRAFYTRVREQHGTGQL